MNKKFLTMILFLVGIVSSSYLTSKSRINIPISEVTIPASESFFMDETPREMGLLIDLSNRYFSVDDLKKFIELVATAKESGFLHLHLTNNLNVGIECKSCNQIADEETLQRDGSYKSKVTSQKFLSFEQMRIILDYAKDKNVEIVPEIDMPGHVESFYLLEKAKDRKQANKLFFTDGDIELNIYEEDAIAWAKSIYDEYTEFFKGCKYFHIGGDEFFSGDADINMEFINTIASYVADKGFIVRVWNDLIEKTNLGKLNKDVQVTYWSWDGDMQDEDEVKHLRSIRSPLTDIQKEKISVLNYNSYYLYTCPNKEDVNEESKEYMCEDVRKNWDITLWDGRKGTKASTDDYIIGAAVSIWNEDSEGLENDEIYDFVAPLFTSVWNKIK